MEIGTFWWKEFQTLFNNSYGDTFRTQRELKIQSLQNTIQKFHSTADALQLSNLMFEHWIKPPIFEESKKFFELSKLPIYIVSNIDSVDIIQALAFHDLKPAGIFTSEDAKSYKPRKELFELALSTTGHGSDEVVHIGDSLSSDIKGANEVGIQAVWINRNNREAVDFYSLDVIISVGYRVKSQRGVQFRIWATNILKEYMKKGFAMDDERLKNLGGGGFFKELLERIRDIRASEKVFYRQVLEIYATSIDYDPKADISVLFFQKVQYKIHYAVHGETAAEVIYHKADAEKDFMGLTTQKV